MGVECSVLGARVVHVERQAHPRVRRIHRDEGAVIHGPAAQDTHPQRTGHEGSLRSVLGDGWPHGLLVGVRVRVRVRVRVEECPW